MLDANGKKKFRDRQTSKYLKDDGIGEVMMSMTFKADQSEFFSEDTWCQCLVRSYIKPQCDVPL